MQVIFFEFPGDVVLSQFYISLWSLSPIKDTENQSFLPHSHHEIENSIYLNGANKDDHE